MPGDAPATDGLRDRGQRHRHQHRAAEPSDLRACASIRLTALIAYAGVGGFNQNTPSDAGPCVSGHLLGLHCPSFVWKDKTGNLPNIPVEQVMPNPNLPKQVFAGTDWGLYYTDDITQSISPVWTASKASRA